MRIQKFIAECGVCSRRAAEELVAAGKIMVNGSVAEIGMDIDPENDRVLYSGKRIYIKATEKQYFIFYKPRGVITSMKRESEDEKRAIVADFIKRIKGRVYPVGRLDRDSEGILILTDDGEAALRMTHPRYHVNKTYRVTVRGDVSESQLEKLRNGVQLEDGLTKPATVVIQSQASEKGETEDTDLYVADNVKIIKTALHMTISEGKNRQIRRMCEAVGLEVMLLKRIAVGEILLGRLKPGEYRPMTELEKERLLKSLGLTYVAPEKKAKPVVETKHGKPIHRHGREKSVNERRFIKQIKKLK
ncbi:MAG: rRNA pseudouridine synthase [Ruminococcaceae bacterium]|nr:rRNA pseudouridine synthase [Oscillospiraceae bacterium]